jgi:hypothetical protein
MDGQPTDNLPTVVYNFRLRDSTDPVKLVVLRGKEQQTLSVPAVEQRSDFDSVAAQADPEKNLIPELGILGIEIDPRIAAAATGLRGPNGVIVAARAAGATSEVPLLPRDVIRSLNNRPIASLQDVREAIKRSTRGAAMTLQIQREERLMYVTFLFE